MVSNFSNPGALILEGKILPLSPSSLRRTNVSQGHEGKYEKGDGLKEENETDIEIRGKIKGKYK